MIQLLTMCIVDDEDRVREQYRFIVEDAGYIPKVISERLGGLDSAVRIVTGGDAAICDHQIQPSGYARCSGAQLVSTLYRNRFPALLCTTYRSSNEEEFRALRRWLPVIIAPEELNEDSIRSSVEMVQSELEGKFAPSRRPWRALVKFVDFQSATQMVSVKLPGWGGEAVALRLVDLPPHMQSQGERLVGHRAYASANLSSERPHELYITDWEELR